MNVQTTSDLTVWMLGRDGRPFTELELHEPVDDHLNTSADLDISLGRAEAKVSYTRIGPMTREEEREQPMWGWGWVVFRWVPLSAVEFDPGPPQPARWAARSRSCAPASPTPPEAHGADFAICDDRRHQLSAT